MRQSELHGEAGAGWWVDMTAVPGKFSSDCFAFLSKQKKKKKIKLQLTQFLGNHRTLTDVSLSDSGRKAVD